MLIILSNTSDREQSGGIDRFRHPVRSIADAVTGEKFSPEGKTIKLPVPPRGYRAIIAEF